MRSEKEKAAAKRVVDEVIRNTSIFAAQGKITTLSLAPYFEWVNGVDNEFGEYVKAEMRKSVQ